MLKYILVSYCQSQNKEINIKVNLRLHFFTVKPNKLASGSSYHLSMWAGFGVSQRRASLRSAMPHLCDFCLNSFNCRMGMETMIICAEYGLFFFFFKELSEQIHVKFLVPSALERGKEKN